MKRKCFVFLFLLFFLAANLSLASDFKTISQTQAVNINQNLIVEIEVDAGMVSFGKNPVAGQIHIEGEMNEELDDLDTGFDERHNEFSLKLDRGDWFNKICDDNSTHLKIWLPDNVNIKLNSQIKAGEIEYDLGGLSLVSFELHNFAGEVMVDFAQPNKIEMDFLEIDVKIGETHLRRLGNAKFSDAEINGGIGEMDIDLTGTNATSSQVNIDLDIGSASITLPDDSGIKLQRSALGFLTDGKMDRKFEKRGRYFYTPNYEKAVKTMMVSIHSGIGELKVDLQ